MATKAKQEQQAQNNKQAELDAKVVLGKATIAAAIALGKGLASSEQEKQDAEQAYAEARQDAKGRWIEVLKTLCPGSEGAAAMLAPTPHQEAFILLVLETAWKEKGFKGEMKITPPPAGSTDADKAKYWPTLNVYRSWYRKLFRAGNIASQGFLLNIHTGVHPDAKDAKASFDAMVYLAQSANWQTLNDRATNVLHYAVAAGMMDADKAPKKRGIAATGNATKVLTGVKKDVALKVAVSNSNNAADARVMMLAVERGYAAAMPGIDKLSLLREYVADFIRKCDALLEPVTLTPPTTVNREYVDDAQRTAHATVQAAAMQTGTTQQPSGVGQADIVQERKLTQHADDVARGSKRRAMTAAEAMPVLPTLPTPSATDQVAQQGAKRTRRSSTKRAERAVA